MIDLPAGPELDRLIAEKVMGWTARMDDATRGDWYDKDGTFQYCLPESFIGLRPFSPSTNIAHTWVVVERLRAIGCLEVLVVTWPAGGFAAIVENADAHDTGHILAPTAPLAICRAALKAIGHQ